MSAPATPPATARIAAASWLALLLLCVLWELWLAPLRPGGSWLVLKALPLLLLMRGVWRADVKQLQWALLLVLLYAAEGSVRVFDAGRSALLAWIELALVLLFFVAAVAYLRPFKRAARSRKAAS